VGSILGVVHAVQQNLGDLGSQAARRRLMMSGNEPA